MEYLYQRCSFIAGILKNTADISQSTNRREGMGLSNTSRRILYQQQKLFLNLVVCNKSRTIIMIIWSSWLRLSSEDKIFEKDPNTFVAINAKSILLFFGLEKIFKWLPP